MACVDLNLRLALDSDAQAIASMSRDLIEAGLGWQYRPRRVRELLADRETVTLVACERERVIGFAVMTFGEERAHLVLMAVRSLRRSRTGSALIATRDNEAAVRTTALNPVRMKLTGFLVSGGIAGFAGALFIVHQRGVNNGSFSADINIALFLMVVVGGLGSITGVVIGAIYVWGTQYFLHGGWSLVASGFGILLLLLVLPEGLGGLLYTVRDELLRRVAARRGLSAVGVGHPTDPAAGLDPGTLAAIDELAPPDVTSAPHPSRVGP